MVATATSGTGVPKVYRVTQGLKAESAYFVEFIGAQGQAIELPTRGFSIHVE